MTEINSFEIKGVKVSGETIYIIRYHDSIIHLLGTSHLNPRYVLMVNELINQVDPEVVGVEFCRTRMGHRNSLNGHYDKPPEFIFAKIPSNMLHTAVGEKLRLTYAYGAVRFAESKEFRLNLLKYKRMRIFKLHPPTKVGKFRIGAELMAPFKNQVWHTDNMESKYLSNSYVNYKILLIDRPVEKTFYDMGKVLSEKEKKMIKNYNDYFEEVFLNISELQNGNLMDQLWKTNPKMGPIFIDDRDRFMAKVIFKAITSDEIKNMVCVVGRSHVSGVLRYLRRLAYRSELKEKKNESARNDYL